MLWTVNSKRLVFTSTVISEDPVMLGKDSLVFNIHRLGQIVALPISRVSINRILLPRTLPRILGQP